MSHSVPLPDLVRPLRIPTPFAVGEVWCYLICDEKTVLVDCGHQHEEAMQHLVRGLRSAGRDVSGIDEIWLTHGHPDHFGQASVLAGISGATVYGHRKERANFAGNDDRERFAAFFREEGIPREQIRLMVSQLDWLQQYQQPIRPEWVEEGETLSTGTLDFRVKHAPGHAPGHLVFHREENRSAPRDGEPGNGGAGGGILFGGDVLLEHISTNALINFDPDSGERNRSLLQYRDSLRWIRERKGTVLPGHGKFIPNAADVAAHHLEEQGKRYGEITALLGEEALSLHALAGRIFPGAVGKGNVFLALSEVLGYLDWGRRRGEIVREAPGGKPRYRVPSG